MTPPDPQLVVVALTSASAGFGLATLAWAVAFRRDLPAMIRREIGQAKVVDLDAYRGGYGARLPSTRRRGT